VALAVFPLTDVMRPVDKTFPLAMPVRPAVLVLTLVHPWDLHAHEAAPPAAAPVALAASSYAAAITAAAAGAANAAGAALQLS
jgi:hypothetical protein